MKWSRGWFAALVLAVVALLAAAVYLSFGTDGTWGVPLPIVVQEGETQTTGAALGIALCLAVSFLAYVMFETNLIGNFIVILICAAWILKSCFLG